ncbi:hypothetical protein OIU92_00205 [Escherichia coli]|nr:hypothetical protein [Escherichia coli]
MADGEIGFAIGLSADYQPVSDSLQKNIDDFRQVVVLKPCWDRPVPWPR